MERRIQLVTLLKTLGLPLIGAELGVAEGNFSLQLLTEGMESLYLVDKWETTEGQYGDGGFPQEWHDNNLAMVKTQLAKYQDKYTILKGDTSSRASDIPDSSLSLLYIDADHSFTGTLADLRSWYPKVRSGGVIAGHDYLSPDYEVKPALDHFLTEMNLDPNVVFIIPENSPWDSSFYFIKP